MTEPTSAAFGFGDTGGRVEITLGDNVFKCPGPFTDLVFGAVKLWIEACAVGGVSPESIAELTRQVKTEKTALKDAVAKNQPT